MRTRPSEVVVARDGRQATETRPSIHEAVMEVNEAGSAQVGCSGRAAATSTDGPPAREAA